MYNHEPVNYNCPFCALVRGNETEYNKQEDIVYQDEQTIAFVSPKWWIHNPGHILVIPKEHVENIYDISDILLSKVYITTKKLARAIKEAYHADGISTRQHNEPAGTQDVWHFHVHVFPRYEDDRLYQNQDNKRFVTQEEKEVFIKKLKEYFKTT